MRLVVRSFMVTISALGLAAAVAAVPAHALTEGSSKWGRCAWETFSNEVVERYTTLISPSNGASVPMGTTVNFSAESSVDSPLTFRVASSPALLGSPDIDSGPGSLHDGVYTFSSATASIAPRTIYWDATYTSVLEGCETPPVTFTTPPRELSITPTAAAIPPSPPSVQSGKLLLTLDDTGAFQLGHPSVRYRLHCTTSCAGSIHATAWLVRLGRKPAHVAKLDFGPASVAINAATGGSQQFAYDYRASAVRKLKSILHEGDAVEVRLTAAVSDASGGVARAHTIVWLRG